MINPVVSLLKERKNVPRLWYIIILWSSVRWMHSLSGNRYSDFGATGQVPLNKEGGFVWLVVDL